MLPTTVQLLGNARVGQLRVLAQRAVNQVSIPSLSSFIARLTDENRSRRAESAMYLGSVLHLSPWHRLRIEEVTATVEALRFSFQLYDDPQDNLRDYLRVKIGDFCNQMNPTRIPPQLSPAARQYVLDRFARVAGDLEHIKNVLEELAVSYPLDRNAVTATVVSVLAEQGLLTQIAM